ESKECCGILLQYSVSVFCLQRMSMHYLCAWCPRRLKEDVEYPRIGWSHR
ncbi:hypothetical protein LEMLEM_LOCUS8975, partial [Lemmus lemmus]